jgi:hypothetical protein
MSGISHFNAIDEDGSTDVLDVCRVMCNPGTDPERDFVGCIRIYCEGTEVKMEPSVGQS